MLVVVICRLRGGSKVLRSQKTGAYGGTIMLARHSKPFCLNFGAFVYAGKSC